MPSHSETFGRVFVPSQDNPGEFEQLRSICFSNLDLKWYDLTGDIHPKFNEYSRSKISLGFTIKNKNRFGEMEEFRGRFQLLLKLGEIKTPDVEYLDELHQIEKGFAKKFNLISGEDDPHAKNMDISRPASMFVLMTPGTELVRQSNLFPYLSLITTFDDILDSNSPEVSDFTHNLPYKQLKSLSVPTLNIYREGKQDFNNKMDDITSAIGKSGISVGVMFELNRINNSFIKINQSIYDEALKMKTRSDAEPFFQSILDSIDGHALQLSKEWQESVKAASLRGARMELSSNTVATLMVGEAIAFLRGIKLNPDIRSSFLFKWFLQEAANHAGKLNDLLSYNKEAGVEDDCNQNEVYIHHVENDLPLETALEMVLNDINQGSSALMEAANLLLEIHNNDENLAEYIQIVKEVICGYLQWAALGSRYHPKITFDCYVEGE